MCPQSHIGIFSLATVDQVLNVSFCNSSINYSNLSLLLFGYAFPRFALSGALVILIIFPTLKQAVGTYRATKQWQPNLYARQLVKDGLLYFVA